MLRDEPAPEIGGASLADHRRTALGSALGQRPRELVELGTRRPARPQHLVEPQQLVVREGDQLGAPAQVFGELRVSTPLGEIGLQGERFRRDAHVVRVHVAGENGVQRDLGQALPARRANGVTWPRREGVGQLGHDASSSTGSAALESRRSIATSCTTRAW